MSPVAEPSFQELRELMRRQVTEGLRPSIQISVDWRGESVLDAAEGEGADPGSCYLLWSSTKPFIAVALLQLVDEGAATLDDRVAKHLPEFGCNGKERATLVDVLTHRGGFPGTGAAHARELARLAPDWDGALAYVCQMEADWEPGLARGYHPRSGWYVLGELIQRLDGRPLPEALRARVLEPLGIGEAGFSLGTPEKLGSAPQTVRTRDERGAPAQKEADYWNDPVNQRGVVPGAGGIARASDVVKLYRALLEGGKGANGQLLSEEMTRAATFPHVVGSKDRTFLRDIPWGLGLHLKHVRPALDDCGTLASPGTFGHGGHFLVNTCWADPRRDLAVCILSNGLSEPRAGLRAVTALSDAVHTAIDRARATG